MMNPVITATVAIVWATVVGFVGGYFTRKLGHECPETEPLVVVPRGASGWLIVSHGVEVRANAVKLLEGGQFNIRCSIDAEFTELEDVAEPQAKPS